MIWVGDHQGAPWMPSYRWAVLAFYTAIAFGCAAAEFKKQWKKVSFWLLLVALLALHYQVFKLAFHILEPWPLLWFIPITYAETMLLIAVLDRTFVNSAWRHGNK